ncbi:hypothetical protein [Acaryochloris sp. IP29b_bin.137]|uniref:hypothetical protein n=1 Tax=Acaryochloris sp. IP29b_bin.137 TaxID=2969217 RepID=UPI002604770B|nr:hypothetical protein [Acaryochloris sp. IP29b_bin.137]
MRAIYLGLTEKVSPNYARQVLPLSEGTQIVEMKARYQKAKVNLAIANAKLQNTQQQRAMRHNTIAQQADSSRQLSDNEMKLASFGVVRAPCNGTIKSIK